MLDKRLIATTSSIVRPVASTTVFDGRVDPVRSVSHDVVISPSSLQLQKMHYSNSWALRFRLDIIKIAVVKVRLPLGHKAKRIRGYRASCTITPIRPYKPYSRTSRRTLRLTHKHLEHTGSLQQHFTWDSRPLQEIFHQPRGHLT